MVRARAMRKLECQVLKCIEVAFNLRRETLFSD